MPPPPSSLPCAQRSQSAYSISAADARGAQVVLETPREVLEAGDEPLPDEEAAGILDALERGEF